MRDQEPNKPKCQKHCLKRIADPESQVISPPLPLRLRLNLTRRLNPRHKKMILKTLDRVVITARATGQGEKVCSLPKVDYKAGDRVRIRPREEIEKTLDQRGQLKGCFFMEEMAPYCGTTQRVFKPVTRFVDERDQKVKKTKGIVLIEDALCRGTRKFGPCDRSCFYFWRTEWLEKL